MRDYDEAVHIAARCDYCDAHNTLTASKIDPTEEVRCSRCGNPMGTFETLLSQAAGSQVGRASPTGGNGRR